MVGCYGNKKMITPNLDTLAQEGIRYENAYTCQPVCGPARSAIFTGTFPHTNGMVTNGVPLGANVKTIGQRLTDNGIKWVYRKMAFRWWGLFWFRLLPSRVGCRLLV